MNHLRLRNFLVGHAHANSAPPWFGLKDIEFEFEYQVLTTTPDDCEKQMMEIHDAEEFWYSLGYISDEGYTLKGPEDEQLLCFKYLDETL